MIDIDGWLVGVWIKGPEAEILYKQWILDPYCNMNETMRDVIHIDYCKYYAQ